MKRSGLSCEDAQDKIIRMTEEWRVRLRVKKLTQVDPKNSR